MAITGQDFSWFLTLLGIDIKNVVSADIHIHAGDIVTADIKYYVEVKKEKKMKTELKKYKLVKIEED